MKIDHEKYSLNIKDTLIVIIVFVVSKLILNYKRNIPMLSQICIQILLGIIMLIITILSEGKYILGWKKGTGIYALKKSAYKIILTICIVLCIPIGSKMTLNSDTFFKIMWIMFFCASVGFFEEGLFRMVILNAIERIFSRLDIDAGKAVWISAIVFGLVHVVEYIPEIPSNPFSIILQMLYKIATSGSYGLLLGFIFVKTRNIWSCMLIHALTDFIALLPECLYDFGASKVEYVHTDVKFSVSSLLTGLILCLIFSIPNIVISMGISKAIKKEDLI